MLHDYIITNNQNHMQEKIREGNRELVFKLNASYDPQYILELQKYGINTNIEMGPTYVNDEIVEPGQVIDLLTEYRLRQANGEKDLQYLSLNGLFNKMYGLLNELDIKL